MNVADFQKVNALMSEKRAIQGAVQVLARGGRIVGMTVGSAVGQAGGIPMGLNVPTGYISYPPEMVDAIQSAFTAREQQITQELEQLGVTGM